MFFVSIRSVRCLMFIVGLGCKSEDPPADEEWQNFVSQYAHTYCDLRAQCDNEFDSEFGDQEQCRKEVLTNKNKRQERRSEDGCAFDARGGRDCVDALTVMTCQEWLDGGHETVCRGSLWSCE